MKTNRIFIIIIFITNFTFSQNPECKHLSEEFYYFEIDIRTNDSYPVIMYGLTKTLNLKNFSKDNKTVFLNDLYENSYFVPDLYFFYDKFVLRCLGKEKGENYIKDNPSQGSYIINNILSKSTTKSFYLKSGEIVYLMIIKIKGKFWENDIDSSYFNSNEMKLKIIKTCLIPFEINCFKRIKSKEIEF